MARTVDPIKYRAKRTHILEAAARLFARKGFEKTTTADICAAAGISSGSLFHYFPNKRAIFLAIFEQDGRDNAELLAAADRNEDAWAGLLELVSAMIRPLAEPALGRLAFELVTQASRDPELAELVAANDETLHAGVTGLLERAAADGRIDPEIPPRIAAGWICGLADTAYFRAALDPEFQLEAEENVLGIILARFLRVR